MHLIRLTKKAQKHIGLPPKKILENPIIDSSFGQWYCSIKEALGSQCLVLVDGKTRLNFVIPDIPEKAFGEIPQLFKSHLSSALSSMEFSESEKSILMQDISKIGFANTQSPKMMARVNEISWYYQAAIERRETLDSSEINKIIKTNNYYAVRDINNSPIDETRALLNLIKI